MIHPSSSPFNKKNTFNSFYTIILFQIDTQSKPKLKEINSTCMPSIFAIHLSLHRPNNAKCLIQQYWRRHILSEFIVQIATNANQIYSIQINYQSTMALSPTTFALLSLLLISASGLYCSSTCIDYTGACFDETPQGCWVCATNIFNMNANLSSATPCTAKSQNTIIANELPNTGMTLAGYTSTKTSTVTCTNYTFSGTYTNADYIYKNFTGIPLNHYALVVRFSVGYIGQWDQTDYLRLTLADPSQTVNYDYRYICDYPENINGEVGVNTTDCIRIRQYILTHNTSYVFLNFSALTSISDPTIQFWGIKELIISAKVCHSYCLTCFGALNSQCLSCANGYYLQGNVCLPVCDNNMYVVADARMCVSQCPPSYYPHINPANSEKSCLNCPAGCSICSTYNLCQAWSNQSAYIPDLWKDKLQFWILLIIVVTGLIAFAIYKFIKSNMPPSDLQENMMSKSDEKEQKEKDSEKGKGQQVKGDKEVIPIPNDSVIQSLGGTLDLKGESLWFNELVEMEPIEVKVRGRKRRNKQETKDQIQVSSVNAHQGTSTQQF